MEPILAVVAIIVTAVIAVMGISALTDDLPLPPPSSGRLA
jgi:hypothetical protein